MRNDLRGRNLESINMMGAFFNWCKQQVAICMSGAATPEWLPINEDNIITEVCECQNATRRVGPQDNAGALLFVPQLPASAFQAERQLLLPWWYLRSNQIH